MTNKQSLFDYLLKTLSIRQYLIPLWLMPIIILGIIYGTYIINTYSNDITNSLSNNRLNTLNYLASTSGFSMFSADISTLTRVADSINNNEDIKGILFVSDTLEIVARSSGLDDINPNIIQLIPEYDAYQVIKQEKDSYVFSPIYAEGISSGDSAHKQLLGYVLMMISDEYLEAINRELLVNSFAFLYAAIFILVVLSAFYSKKINQYIVDYMKVITDLSLGDYNKNKTEHYPREIKELYERTNHLSNELSDYRDKMDIKVDKATKELTLALNELEDKNKALDDSRIIAESATKSKDMFLARMSHELRTPVNALIGFSKLAKDERSGEKQKEYNEIIRNSSQHLLAIIDDLLDLSILELGEFKINKAYFNPREIFDEITSIYSEKIFINNIKLIIDIDTKVSTYIHADRTRLMQILNNLISNSIKFTQHGEIRMEANVLDATDTMQKIEFIVEDTGCGMKKEDLDSIFKSFVQLHELFYSSQGIGLGLPIVKHLVQAMNGIITVESKEGVGTKFSIVFEIETRGEDELNVNYETDLLDRTDEGLILLFKNKNILIAEDHDYSRLLLIEYLNQFNINTIEAKSGSELLELLPDSKPDLLLIDIHMPGYTGIELSKIIRDLNTENCMVPIILMTADITVIKNENYLMSGANDIVLKPIDVDELINKIFNLIGDAEIPDNMKELISSSLVNESELSEEFKKLINLVIEAASNENEVMLRDNLHKLHGISELAQDRKLCQVFSRFKEMDTTDIDQIKNELKNILKMIH